MIYSNGLQIRASFSNTKFKDALKIIPSKIVTDLRKLDPHAMLSLRSVVHEATCNLCWHKSSTDSFHKTSYAQKSYTQPFKYIGETGRCLKERLYEHFTLFTDTTKRSEIANHSISTHGVLERSNWSFRILGIDRDPWARKISEAKFIAKSTGLLNKNGGITYLS